MSQIDAEFQKAVECGMALAMHANALPDNMAVHSKFGVRSFGELNQRCNQLARLFRSHGIGLDDGVAVVTRNCPAFVETYFATLRIGARFTPVNWHLTAEEAGYVIDNCEAKAVVYDAGLASAIEAVKHAPECYLKLAVAGDLIGFRDYESALADFEHSDIDEPVRGSLMLYTSGTTGKPKGVYRKQQPLTRTAAQEAAAWNPLEDRTLCTGPAYHAAPFAFNILAPLNAGVGVVLMDKWDAEETLQLIEQWGITHTHLVATMFHRLLQLPEAIRNRYDLSTLKFVLHGAAPCPVHVKQAMIDWLGPVIYEYYAATEGGGNFFIDSHSWLKKPGSVGRSGTPGITRILDDEGNEKPQGESGLIYFKAPEVGRFEYFKTPAKTSESYRDDWFTLGDMGYFDSDGYLFLNGRSAETIISGGVNIYPQEIDEELLKHKAVQDVCTIGVPNDEWGEEVKAVVLLKQGWQPDESMAEDLLSFARDRLPGFKLPRSIDFIDELPRLPSGKIQRRLVRAPYWKGQGREI